MMLKPILTNYLSTTTLGLASAPLHGAPLPSAPQELPVESKGVDTPNEPLAGRNAALFAAAAPLASPAAQESLLSLSAIMAFYNQIDSTKLLVVMTLFSITIARFGFRNAVFPLYRLVKRVVQGDAVEHITMNDDSDPVNSWTSWPPPISSAPPAMINGQRFPQPFESINNASGFVARHIDPLLNPFLVGGVSALSASAQLYNDISSPLAAYVPEVLATGLAIYNMRYRRRVVDSPLIRHLDQQNILLTASAWRHHIQRPLGIFGPDVIGTFAPEEQYEIGRRYYEGPASQSWFRGFWAFVELIGYCSKMVQQVRYSMSRSDFNEEMNDFVKNGNIQPVDPKAMRIGSVLVRQWAINDADRKRANIIIRNEDRLAELAPGSLNIYYGNHKSIWPDFWGAFLLETQYRHIRMVADIDNFATSAFFRSRIFSKLFMTRNVALALMKLGLIYVARSGSKSKHDWMGDLIAKMELGISPLMYPEGGREAPTSTDDGKPDVSGMLSSVASLKHPEQLLHYGLLKAAMQIAYRKKKPVNLIFLKQTGSDRIAPKIGKWHRTYIQPATLNQDAIYDIAEKEHIIKLALDEETCDLLDALENTYDDNERQTLRMRLDTKREEYLQEMIRVWLEITQEAELIRERYQDWVRKERPAEAAHLSAVFKERSESDYRYLQMAGRLRAIKPRFKERQELKDKLHSLVAADTPSEVDIVHLNAEIAKQVKHPWNESGLFWGSLELAIAGVKTLFSPKRR